MLSLNKILSSFIFLLLLTSHQVFASQTVNIKDINDSLSKKDVARITAVAEKELAFYSDYLEFDKPVEIPVRLFKSSREYKRYQKKVSKSTTSNGFYSSKRKELIINRNDNYLKTIYRESQDLILSSKIRRAPKWIDYGMAEFYETAYTKGDQVYVKIQKSKYKRIEEWRKQKKLPTVAGLIQLSNSEWSKVNVRPNYVSGTLSWALIYFFMSTQERRDVLGTTIAVFNKNSSRPVVEVLHRLYEGGLQALEEDFHKFLDDIPRRQEL